MSQATKSLTAIQPGRPPILYKYFPVERLDVLRDGTLRFTQPTVFNDPFECSPTYKGTASKKEMERISKIEAARHGMPEELRRRIVGMHFRKENLLTSRAILEMLARGVGVLSLTEKRDNLLMWAHYAESHEGFAIGFRTAHPFFSRPDAKLGGVHDIRKIRYSSKRPGRKFFSQLQLADTYFVKSRQWEYEQEWRMYTVLPREDSMPVLVNMLHAIIDTETLGSLPPCPVRLFEFPSDCVREIIIGCRASEKIRSEIRKISAARYPHAKVFETQVSETDFRLVFKELTFSKSSRGQHER